VANERQLSDWLTTYTEYTSEQESPSLFHFWVGCSVLAAAMDRKCYLPRGYYSLHPNLYVILIGASARVRKTSAINIGFNLFKEALPDATMISQKATAESMISILVSDYKSKQVSSAVIVSDELGVFLGGQAKDASIMQLLTKWYDCPKHFEYHTMARGKEVMDNVCCNMLAGTTPQWLKDSMPAHAIGGGFTSRIIFVYQDRPEKLVPFPEINLEMEKLRVKLMHDLQTISKMSGTYSLTKDAHDWYKHWYCEEFKPETTPHMALDGYFGRKHDTLLKVGMVLAASRSNETVVNSVDLQMGLKALEMNEKTLPETLKLIQMSDSGEEVEKIHRILCRKGEIHYNALTSQVSYCMPSQRVNEIMKDLCDSNKVVEFFKNGKRYFKINVEYDDKE
jgi:hypothetical protein